MKCSIDCIYGDACPYKLLNEECYFSRYFDADFTLSGVSPMKVPSVEECFYEQDIKDIRRKVAIAMLPSTSQMSLANSTGAKRLMSVHAAVALAFDYADEFIKQLEAREKDSGKVDIKPL